MSALCAPTYERGEAYEMRFPGVGRRLSGSFPDEGGKRYAQHACQEAQIQNGDIAFTTLDGPNKRAMQATRGGQFRLREVARLALLTQSIAQACQKLPVVQVHGRRLS